MFVNLRNMKNVNGVGNILLYCVILKGLGLLQMFCTREEKIASEITQIILIMITLVKFFSICVCVCFCLNMLKGKTSQIKKNNNVQK